MPNAMHTHDSYDLQRPEKRPESCSATTTALASLSMAFRVASRQGRHAARITLLQS